MMSAGKESDVNISQAHINFVLAAYMKNRSYDSRIVANICGGDCCGYSTLFLYSMWLSKTQPKLPKSLPCDDWEWMLGLLQEISRWDGEIDSIPKGKQENFFYEIDRLIALINFFQRPFLWLYDLKQDQCESLLSDTKGRTFCREYSLAGIFTARNFTRKFALPAAEGNDFYVTTLFHELVREDRMVLILSHDHVMGLFRHEGLYYFFDPNDPEGVAEYSEGEEEEIIDHIFNACDFPLTSDIASPLSFCIFNSAEKTRPDIYPKRAILLKAVSPSLQPKLYGKSVYTVLSLSCDIGCQGSLEYYLNALSAKNKLRPFLVGKMGEKVGKCALRLDVSLLKYLLCEGLSPNTKYRKDALLQIASRYNLLDSVIALVKAGADVNEVDSFGKTAFSVAMINRFFPIANYLLTRKELVLSKSDYEYLMVYYRLDWNGKVTAQFPLLKKALLEAMMDQMINEMQKLSPAKAEVASLRFDFALRVMRGVYFHYRLQDKMMMLISHVLPMMEIPKTWIPLWANLDFKKPILTLAAQMGITREDIIHHRSPVIPHRASMMYKK